MKLIPILAAALLFSVSAAQAQVDQSQTDQEEQKRQEQQQQQDQSTEQDSSQQSEQGKEISEPAGAEKEQATKPDSPYRKGQEAGVPAEEPAGAEQQQEGQQSQQQEQDQQQQPGQEQQPGQDQAGIQNEAAGAQRGGSEQLVKAFGEIKTGATVSATQKTSIQQALTASVQGKNVPNEFITRLSDDLSGVFIKTEIKEDVRIRLAEAINSILTGQITTAPQLEQSLTTIEQTLTSAGVARPAARTVACDMHLIGTELIPDLKIVVPQ